MAFLPYHVPQLYRSTSAHTAQTHHGMIHFLVKITVLLKAKTLATIVFSDDSRICPPRSTEIDRVSVCPSPRRSGNTAAERVSAHVPR